MDRSTPLAVATATTLEMRAVLQGVGAPAGNGHAPEQGEAALARLCGRDCLLLVTGVGPVNAALALGGVLGPIGAMPGEAAHQPPVCGVLNLGVAGSFDLEAAPLCAATTATMEIWPEYGLVTATGVDPKGITLAQGRLGQEPVWDRLPLDPDAAARELDLDMPRDAARGASITVAGVSGTAERAARLRGAYAPLTENMEGFALAFACARCGVPFLEVRTVSNLVGSRATEHWALEAALHALGQAARTLFA
ncbi:MAG: futalosine hydrolase [Desulfovibrionaceae bacterium]